MNQTKKRLAIIKLAISMTDTETIQLQVLKLGLLKTDSRLREILETLNDQNYARAQRLISTYIDSNNETKIVQRTSQETNLFNSEVNSKEITENTMAESMIERRDKAEVQHEDFMSVKDKIQHVKNQAIIDQFQLFTQDSNENEEVYQEANSYDNFVDISPKPKKMSTKTINYDALLNVDVEDVLPDNITLDIEKTNKQDLINHEEAITTSIPKDDFLLEDENIQEETVNTLVDDVNVDSNEPTIEVSDEEDEMSLSTSTQEAVRYEAISYIDQKFKNMQNQYPPIHTSNEGYEKVDTLLLKIAKEGYTETEIEELIKYIDKISQTDEAEAAQLLLIASSTESKYAQFRLARGLYKGQLLQKNPAESFTLIHRLAMNDSYPEAICDLGQFYENGIGITKDKKRAEELYKEAMDLGIHRAIEHYERIRKGKSLFSIFKR